MAPTYEYECEKCGNRFEKFQSMKDEPLKRCPKCRCKIRRLLGSGAGIIFKGSGFYETDYKKRSGYSGSGGADSKSDTKSETKSESKPESKPENKAGSQPAGKKESSGKAGSAKSSS